MVLDNNLEKFYNYISSEKGYSQNTLMAYSNDLKLFADYLEKKNKFEWEKVTKKEITEYFKLLNNSLSQSSKKRKYASIKSFFLFLTKERYISEGIFEDMKSPKVSNPIPKPLSEKEINLIIDFKNKDKFYIRDSCIFMLMYASGLRVSEVIGIKIGEVDTENNSVKVTGKGNKQRILPIYNKANEKINEYIKKIRPYFSKSNSYSSLLFLNKNSKIITRQYVWRSLKIRGIEKGIVKNITPHMIRHSFATHLLHGGASIRHVQEFLGHSSIESTQIYTKIPNQKLIEDYNIAHPRGNK
tara:strand:+ start:6293 stop:7189 length:897 start_codon:yes stop_codon:yes gene_type:complete